MELSKEQQLAFDKYISGENIFITGPGGSGKSALIRKINEHAQSRFKNIQVCALTGCAAVLLNCKAKTLHSWSSIGLGNGTHEQLVTKIQRNKFAKSTWRDTQILVVDEVSMLSLKLFEVLNLIGKEVRRNSRPFGGIQLIFSGDFYQLPPVGNKDEPDTQKFCFESPTWNTVFNQTNQIQLIKIFRQTDDIYSTILNQIREGKIKRKSNDLLMTHVGREYNNLVGEPTKLYPTKNKVEQINNSKMVHLKTEEKRFEIKLLRDLEMSKNDKIIRRSVSDRDIQIELDFLSGNLICDKIITIKVGCQVMCVVNIKSPTNDTLVCNGSQGIVIGYCETTGCPIVKYNNGIELTMVHNIWQSEKIPGIGVSQVPLILAWALTIHKSQGATLDVAEIDVGSGIFECGQTYVALSRVKSLEGLYLTSFDATKIRINRKVKTFYDELTEYQQRRPLHDEQVVEAVAIAVAIPIAQVVSVEAEENPFTNFQYNNSI
jgi:ATP-dependent DNA helicase PIF1